MDTPPRPDATVGAAARYRTLLEINNAVISNLTQDALFHAIAQALRGVVAFDRTAVFLHDPERDVLRLFVLESSLSTSYFTVGLEMPSGESHVGRVFKTQRSLLRHDLAKERQYPMEDRAPSGDRGPCPPPPRSTRRGRAPAPSRQAPPRPRRRRSGSMPRWKRSSEVTFLPPSSEPGGSSRERGARRRS